MEKQLKDIAGDHQAKSTQDQEHKPRPQDKVRLLMPLVIEARLLEGEQDEKSIQKERRGEEAAQKVLKHK